MMSGIATGDEIKLAAVERKGTSVSLEETHIGGTLAGRQVAGFFEHGSVISRATTSVA
jgi:hypothetical protein